MTERNRKTSFFVRAGWWFASILAVMAAFAGTGPGYHATVAFVRDYAIDQYGYVMAAIVIWLWWAVVAALLFLGALLGIVIVFFLVLLLIRTWLP